MAVKENIKLSLKKFKIQYGEIYMMLIMAKPKKLPRFKIQYGEIYI